jgi:diketogulonate reductase-like aldo/keto reductase
LLKLSARYFKSPAQILIRWALQHGYSVIPKSEKKTRIFENATVFDFALADDDLLALDGMNEGLMTSWNPVEFA